MRFHLSEGRLLKNLAGIGTSMLGDFELLDISTVEQLALQQPEELYLRLCGLTGSRQDICVLDVFRCAVAQAMDPLLPKEQCQWWWWSRQRRAGLLSQGAGR